MLNLLDIRLTSPSFLRKISLTVDVSILSREGDGSLRSTEGNCIDRIRGLISVEGTTGSGVHGPEKEYRPELNGRDMKSK